MIRTGNSDVWGRELETCERNLKLRMKSQKIFSVSFLNAEFLTPQQHTFCQSQMSRLSDPDSDPDTDPDGIRTRTRTRLNNVIILHSEKLQRKMTDRMRQKLNITASYLLNSSEGTKFLFFRNNNMFTSN